jgi:uncharacterized protein (DUF1330 family)
VTEDSDGPFVVGFVGYTDPDKVDQAAAYEDAVLPLLADHGARVLYRGRRAPGEDPALPAEIQVVWLPSRAALEAYMADPRRQAAIEKFGPVFTETQVVGLLTVEGSAGPG